MGNKYRPGDFVACYITNTEVFEDLLTWGMVIDVSPTLEDILVLDREGTKNWWPANRWRKISQPLDKSHLSGILA